MARYKDNISYSAIIQKGIENCITCKSESFPRYVKLLYAVSRPYILKSQGFEEEYKELHFDDEEYWYSLFQLIIMYLDSENLLLDKVEIDESL